MYKHVIFVKHKFLNKLILLLFLTTPKAEFLKILMFQGSILTSKPTFPNPHCEQLYHCFFQQCYKLNN